MMSSKKKNRSRKIENADDGCKFNSSSEYKTLCTSHPEIKRVLDASIPEYQSLRERALNALMGAGQPNAPSVPHLSTDLASPELMISLRNFLMRNEILREDEAESMIRSEMRNPNTPATVVKKCAQRLMDLSSTLTKRIQKSSSPRDSFIWIIMSQKRFALMELGLFASARRRCLICAKAGIRRCSQCGLTWYCSEACERAVSEEGKAEGKVATDKESPASDAKSSVDA